MTDTVNREKPIRQLVRNPLFWIPTVYFAMGLPMTLLSDVAGLMYKDLGISDKDIAFYTSLLLLPWSLKPLFGPFMELFGRKRWYVIITEAISAIIPIGILIVLGYDNILLPTILLFAIMAVSGSIHDIAGDGIYMENLDNQGQSKYIGWQGAAYNLAKILARGGLVYLVGVLSHHRSIQRSWGIVFGIAGVTMLIIALYHLRLLPNKPRASVREELSAKEVFREFWHVVKSFFTKKHIIYYLIFILLYRMTEGLAIRIAPLFLKAERSVGGLGLSNEEYGLIYGTLGALAFIIGSIASGLLTSKYGLRRMLLILVIVFNLPFLVYVLLSTYTPTSLSVIASGITIEFFGYGFGFVGLNLFMMQQIAPGKYQMAHYAIGTSLMNMSVMLPGLISGWLSDMVGYRTFFIIAIVVALPSIICSYFVPFTHKDQ